MNEKCMRPYWKLRYDYSNQSLDESATENNPFAQFEKWFKEAVEAKINIPNAMILSTVAMDGRPSARVMLMGDFTEKGFVFYTNYNSRKSLQLEKNSFAAITFFWSELERQIRIEGTIEKQSDKDSNIYFSFRPDGSKLGAWASPQSAVVKNRQEIESLYNNISEKYKNKIIPRPHFWGGYILSPFLLEFWQGRPNRLHDRILYTLTENNHWKKERLAP